MGATHFLPTIVGAQRSARLLLTGEVGRESCILRRHITALSGFAQVITADKAEEWGLVAETVPDDQVLSRAIALADQMGAASPIAVRSCVRSLRMKQVRNGWVELCIRSLCFHACTSQDVGLDQALWREADAQSYCYSSLVSLDGQLLPLSIAALVSYLHVLLSCFPGPC